MIILIDSDAVVGKCLSRNLAKNGFGVELFDNAIDAMRYISETKMPEMIFLDVMLTGPDGFTFLNEMASYTDTMKVPIVIVSEKDFSNYDLSEYGVVGILNKNTMKPEEVLEYARKYAKGS